MPYSETREIEHELNQYAVYLSEFTIVTRLKDRCWENGLKMLCFIFVACSLHVKTIV